MDNRTYKFTGTLTLLFPEETLGGVFFIDAEDFFSAVEKLPAAVGENFHFDVHTVEIVKTLHK